MRPRVVLTGLALFGLLARLEAQPPARDTPGQVVRGAPAAPSARITGRVLAADTGRPVRRARVLLSAPELPGGRGALTDGDGLFDFPELPAGRYSLGVSKSGFVSLAYGQRRPLQPGTPLQLADAQVLRGIEFRLPRGSVITGQIVDEVGDPLPGATVRVLAYRYAQGARQLVPVNTGITDDRGEYRVWGLNPGEYFVSATARNFNLTGAAPAGVARPSAGRGGAPAARGASQPGLPVNGPPSDPAGDTPESTGYAPTYYPGVDSIGQAQPVTLALSVEARDISFGILLVRTSRITGRVVSDAGTPVSTGTVLMAPADNQAGGRVGPGAGFRGRIEWDGAFEVANVPPGRYVLRARGDDWEVPRFATMPLTVTGGDMSGLNVVILPGATVTGTVAFQRTTSLAAEPTQIRIALPSVDGMPLGPPPTGRPDREGRFTIEGVPAGTHRIRTQAPRGWTVRSVVVDGRDVTDVPIDVRSGQRMANVAVTFTDAVSEISGAVRDGRGTPVTAYTVLVFPDDPALWYPQSRHVMTARPDQTGRYQIRGLPSGSYLIAAVDPAEANEWFDPAYLEQQRAAAVRLLLGDGGVKTQDLTVPTP